MIVRDVSSPLLAAAADVTLSHFSTCGLQSLFVGTPTYFSSPNTPMWDSIGSASGLVATASDGDALIHEILETGFYLTFLGWMVPEFREMRPKDKAEVTCEAQDMLMY